MVKTGIILTPDERSKAYIQKIVKNGISLDEILFMNDKRNEKDFDAREINQAKKYGFDISQPVKETLKTAKLDFQQFDFVDINHHDIEDYLKNSQSNFFIFTGGGILKKEILESGPKFIHLHPGIVPEYRGSTCFYYSIIKENKLGVTAYIMDKNLDTGDIIFQKIFEKPDHEFIDNVFDPHIRSETLLEILNHNLIEKGEFRKQDKGGETYYIIHPILKHISILCCVKK